ncbi:MAG: PAS domain S-box protein [Gammaproteobacteria bacterium]|nr:MAG: PAS domain S-box protein [Gammaproteobacteria bacterium]
MQTEGLESPRGMSRGRLLTITVAPIAAILVVILGVNLVTNTKRALTTSEREMANTLGTLSQSFDGELHRVAQVAEQTAKAVTTLGQLSEAEVYQLLENGVLQDPLIYGAAMGFVAGGFDNRQAFCPYVYRDGLMGESVNRLDIAGAYDYLGDPEIRWWHDPVTLGQPVWSEPYFDEGAGNIMMSTYSVPFYQDGELRGVTTIDIPMEPLQDFIGTDLDVVILTSEGRFIHRTRGIPKGNPTILEQAVDRPDLLELARRMMAGETGMGYVDDGGAIQQAFFAPLPSAGWSFAVFKPKDQVLAGARREAWWLAGTMLLSLALITLAMWFVSGLVWRTQAESRAGERRFRRLMESAPDAMIIVNQAGRIVMVNEQAVKAFGYPAEEMTGELVEMLVPGSLREGHTEQVRQFFTRPVRREMGSSMQLRGARADGSEFPIEVGLSPLETSEGLLVSSVVRDVTERQRAAAALAAAEERQRRVLESTSDGIFGVDSNGRAMFINGAAASLLGYEREELLGRSIHDVIHHSRADGKPYPVEECPMHAAFTDGTAAKIDDEVLWKKDGSSFAVEYSSTPLRKDDELVGAVIVFRDITERKTAESELLQARDDAHAANRAKSAFLANMSHELRTPMNAIIGYSEMLEEEIEDEGDEQYLPDLLKIQSAAKHLLALINDILDLSKIEAGRMELYLERFSVGEVLAEIGATVGTLVAKNGNRLAIAGGETAGAMVGDLTKVRQTVFNLISNAAKFTQDGEITLSTWRDRDDEGGDWIIFEVSDTGIGIPAEKMDDLFEEFTQADVSTTREYGGTGLGLAITRRFCELMGGSISCTSTPGEGSTFTIRLPAEIGQPHRISSALKAADESTAVAETGARPLAAHSAGSSRGRVLVIDDDPTIRELLARNLSRDGYDVMLAETGERGLELARSEEVVAITLDVMMSGMDGWSVLRALKEDEATRAIPVIMVTIVDDKNLGYTLGAAEYLTKPVDRKALIAAIHRLEAGGEVLVVDDEPDIRSLTRRTLEAEGLQVREAANGQEALDEIRRRQPGLIILDLMMPVMDGFEFLRQLRHDAKIADLPVIVVTAKDLTGEDRARLDSLVTQVLQKGDFDQEDLLMRVRRSIGAAGAAERH